MKKQISILLFIFTTVIFTSCIVYTPVPHIGEITYANWKAEQKAANDALYKYTQSDYYKKIYGGKNPISYGNSPKANSVVGTKDDPFIGVRNSNNIPPSANSQHYNITIK
jgi:hypothetical protein